MEIKKKHIIFVLLALVLIFAALFAYFSDSAPKGEIPFLKADTGPNKVRPDPESDMTSSKYNPIYDQIKSQKYNTSVNMRPSPEKPVTIESKGEDNITQIVSEKVADTNDIVDNSGQKKLVIVSETSERETKIRKSKRYIYAQVASTRNKDDAEKEWGKIFKNNKKLLNNLGHKVEKFDLKNKGRYYRLLIGPIESAGKAQLVCKKLIGSGISCIIKRI